MSERIQLREYESCDVTAAQCAEMAAGAEILASQLRPSIRQFRSDGRTVSFANVVGSFSLSNGDVVEIAPKIAATDWTSAVLHLLADDTRLAVTGSQQSRQTHRNDDLTTALALEYARRLEQAIRKDGPMQVYERRHEVSRTWRGRLDVSSWGRTRAIDPARFPMSRDELSHLNDFTRGLSVVAGMLSRSAAGSETAARLRRLQYAALPGSPIPSFVSATIARRRMPQQWASYVPAWDIAAPILRGHSVVGDPGRANGLEVAVEPWRLLETLLGRMLRALAAMGAGFSVQPKRHYPLLSGTHAAEAQTHNAAAPQLIASGVPGSVEPDGCLSDASGRVVATFEAKYSSEVKREHVFQALSTAAALNSPLAVLVYPWVEAPKTLSVTGFHGSPSTLVTLGAGIFDYRGSESDRALAESLGTLIRANTAVYSAVPATVRTAAHTAVS